MNDHDKRLEAPSESTAPEHSSKNMADGMSLGINLMVSIGIGAFAGYWVDHFAGTTGLFLIMLGVLGFAAGMMQIWRVMNKD